MLAQQLLELGHIVHVLQGLEIYHILITVHSKHLAIRCQNIGNTPRHPGRKVTTRRTENHHSSTCHVFAAVVSHALDHSPRPAVANCETFGCRATKKRTSTGCTVEHYIANKNIVLWHKTTFRRWIDHDTPARKSLAYIIIGVANQLQGHAAG